MQPVLRIVNGMINLEHGGNPRSYRTAGGLGWVHAKSTQACLKVTLPAGLPGDATVHLWSTLQDESQFRPDNRVQLEAQLLNQRPHFLVRGNGGRNFFGPFSTTIDGKFILFQFVALRQENVVAQSIPFCIVKLVKDMDEKGEAAMEAVAKLRDGPGLHAVVTSRRVRNEWQRVVAGNGAVDDVELEDWQRDMRAVYELEGLCGEGHSFGGEASKVQNLWWADLSEELVKKVLRGMLADGEDQSDGVVYALPFYYAKHDRIFWFCRTGCQRVQHRMQQFKEKPQPGPPYKKQYILRPEHMLLLMQRGGVTLKLPESVSIHTY